MKSVLLYSISVLLFISALGEQKTPSKVELRIYGGQFARDNQFPFMGFLSYSNKTYCGVSIIHKRWALTAAHCVVPRDNPLITVGKVDDTKNGTSFEIDEFYVHIDYTLIPEELNNGLEYVTNDIALIRLSTDIEFNETVQPIELSTDTGNAHENAVATVMGWGKSSFIGLRSKSLRYGEVRVLTIDECQEVWTYADKHVCTSNQELRGVCSGDSGSPLVLDGIQIGITSTTDTYCESLKPDLFTKVADFVPWIKDVMKKHGESLDGTIPQKRRRGNRRQRV